MPCVPPLSSLVRCSARRRKSGRVQGGLARVVRAVHGPDDERGADAPTGYDVAYLLGGKRLNVGRSDLSFTTAADAVDGARGRGRREKRSATAVDEVPGDTAILSDENRQGKKSKTTPENEEGASKVAAATSPAAEFGREKIENKESNPEVAAAKEELGNPASEFDWEKRRIYLEERRRRWHEERDAGDATAPAGDGAPAPPSWRLCGVPGCRKHRQAHCDGLCKSCYRDIQRHGRDPRESAEPAAKETNAGVVRDNNSEEGAEELWDLKIVLGTVQIRQAQKQCQTPGCDLLACTVWESNRSPKEPWFSCLDCQEKDFGGWPEKREEIPIDALRRELRKTMIEKCSRCPNPRMPNMRSLGASEGYTIKLARKLNRGAAKTQKPKAETTETGVKIATEKTSYVTSSGENGSSISDHWSRGASAACPRQYEERDDSAILSGKTDRCGFEEGDKEEAGEDGSECQASHFRGVARSSARGLSHALSTRKPSAASAPVIATVAASSSDTTVVEVQEMVNGTDMADGTGNVAGCVTARFANAPKSAKSADKNVCGDHTGKIEEDEELALTAEDTSNGKDDVGGREYECDVEGGEEDTVGLDQIRLSKKPRQSATQGQSHLPETISFLSEPSTKDDYVKEAGKATRNEWMCSVTPEEPSYIKDDNGMGIEKKELAETGHKIEHVVSPPVREGENQVSKLRSNGTEESTVSQSTPSTTSLKEVGGADSDRKIANDATFIFFCEQIECYEQRLQTERKKSEALLYQNRQLREELNRERESKDAVIRKMINEIKQLSEVLDG